MRIKVVRTLFCLLGIQFVLCGCANVKEPQAIEESTEIENEVNETMVDSEDAYEQSNDEAIVDDEDPLNGGRKEYTEEDNTKKVEWVYNRLHEDAEKIEELGYDKNFIKLCIDDKSLDIPFRGSELNEVGIDVSNIRNIKARCESYGDTVKIGGDENKGIMQIGLFNMYDTDLNADECIVASLQSSSEYFKLELTSDDDNAYQENYEESSYIGMGTSLDDILELLHNHGKEIQYPSYRGDVIEYTTDDTNVQNVLTIKDNQHDWIVEINCADIDENKLGGNICKWTPIEFSTDVSMQFEYVKYVIFGNFEDGVTSIKYDYSYVDANSYSFFYKNVFE